MIGFERPWALLLLGTLPLIWWWMRRIRRIERISFSNTRAVVAAAPAPRLSPRGVVDVLTAAAVACTIVAVAGPRRGIAFREETRHVVDIMLCLDTSTSMEALDFRPKNRFEVAREAAREFIQRRANDRLGLVVFSALAMLQCPLTVDHDTLLQVLDRSSIGMVRLDGTNISAGLLTCVARMQDAAGVSRVVVLLTDGRHNVGEIDPVTAAQAARAAGIKVYTIGCGVPTGRVPMPVDTVYGRQVVMVPADLDEPILRAIADVTGARYFNVRSREGMLQAFREIDRMEKTEVRAVEYREYRTLHRWFVGTALLALVLRVLVDRVLTVRIP